MSDASLLVPERKSLRGLRDASAGCKACPLWKGTTQTVFGEGLKRSRLMTAAKSLLGKDFRVTRDRGVLTESELGLLAVGTVHPSAILRAPDDEARRAERRHFTDDLRVAAQALH